jgi:hypothetical protein
MPGVTVSTAPAPPSAATVARKHLVSAAEWMNALHALIADAVASKPLYEKVQAMNAWLAANEWHELATERERKRDIAREELRLIENRLFEQAAKVSLLQWGLNEAATQGLTALFRQDLTPHITLVWAIEARRIGSTDLFEIAESARNSLMTWLDEEETA